METKEKNVVYALFNNDGDEMYYYKKDCSFQMANINLVDATLFCTLEAAENTKASLKQDGCKYNVIKIDYTTNIINNSYCIVFSAAESKMKYLRMMDEYSVTYTTLERARVFESVDSAKEFLVYYGHKEDSRFEIIKLD